MPLAPLLAALLLAPFLSALSLPRDTSLRQGHTYYPCTTSSQCIPPLQCTDGRSLTCPAPPCHCLPSSNRVRLCHTRTECPTGESCAASPNFQNPFCIDTQHVDTDPTLYHLIPPNGLSYDHCTDNTSCTSGYWCVTQDGMGCGTGSSCRCLPRDGVRGCDEACRSGELCAQGSFIRRPTCVSETVINTEADMVVVRDGTGNTTGRPAGSGVAFEDCRSDVECREPRRCFKGPDSLCGGEMVAPCTCQYVEGLRECTGRGDCGEGEGCYGGSNEAARYVCVSREVAGRVENLTEVAEATAEAEVVAATAEGAVESEGFCMDAGLLEGWDRGELVFERDVRARVLCDGEGSCATSGHMVVWNGRVMRMGRYCEEVGCERRVVRVNSPRWQMRRRVRSRTRGLEFTAFAARMDTRVEEALLGLMVRVGL